MKLLTKEIMQELLKEQQAPCISLYMATHKSHPDNAQDPIRYKQLVKKLELSLMEAHTSEVVEPMLSSFKALGEDKQFWNHTLDGLAVLATAEVFNVIDLQVPVEDLVVVADSFHTKPLMHYLQTQDRYHVLALSLHEIKLFEGNRHTITPIELTPGIPTNIKDALGPELTEEHLTVASYGGVGGAGGNMYHGHGGKKDEVDKDAERFFRLVSKVIHEHYSKPTGLPLILAALPEHHHLFQEVSNNPFLLTEGIPMNPAGLSEQQLAEKAWVVLEPSYLAKLDALSDQFGEAKSNGKGSDELREVAKAAAAGKVDTLLIEANKTIPGKLIDESLGKIKKAELSAPDVDDLLDDLGELVTRMGGKVMIVPREKMPSETGLAAVYRY